MSRINRVQRRLRLESLEARRLLAILTVTNLDDAAVLMEGDAPGTLRQAIFDANAAAGADEIVFAAGLSGTILLTEGQLEITESVTVTGPGALQLTLEAFDPTPNDDNGDGNRIFLIDDGTSSQQDVLISGLTLTGGDVNRSGGAILSLEHLTLVRSRVTGNAVSSTSGFLTAGGGIYINNANLVIEASTISDNLAYHDDAAVGGGIASGSGNVSLLNSTITGNLAQTQLGVSGGTSYGGGLAVGDGTHHFAHSTINDNRATGMDSFGGGLFFFGVGHSTTLDHTIVANGIAAFGRDASSSIPVTLRHSLVENTSGFSFTDAGGNILNQDPNLGPLQNNGGPTETHALLAASPAVNGGDPSAMAGMGNIPQFDQRGMPFGRVENGHIDIGAFEQALPVTLVVDTLVDEADGDYGPGDLSLREAIGLANAVAGADEIVFAAGLSGTILLTEGQLEITESVTVTGPGAIQLTLEAFDPTPNDDNGDGNRIFLIDDGMSSQQDVLISGLTLTGGDVNSSGGAILSLEHLTLVRSRVTGNAVSSTSGFLTAGGGIYINNANLVIEASTISDNLAYHDDSAVGGGIASGSGNVTLLNSTITGNLARTQLGVSGGTSYGGGLAVGDGTHHFAHSTINDNRAIGMDSFGGGLFFFGVGHSTTLDHTIVANGIAAFGRDASSSIPVTLRHSLVENTSGFSFTDAGGNILNQDPNLGPLQNNGGPTETHALLAASPAVNGGDPSAMAGLGNIPQFDQRGMPFGRVENGHIDIGAFEQALPVTLVVDTLVDEADGDYGPGDLSLREAIGLANAVAGADEIVFAAGLSGTILLTEGQLEITESVTVTGPGAIQLTLEAFDPTPNDDNGDGNRIFLIDDGMSSQQDVLISGLTLTGGDVNSSGGAILSLEHLTLVRSRVTGNAVSSTSGFLTAGGGIYINNANLVIEASTISDNLAYHDDAAVGGGIASGSGNVTLLNSTITGNLARTQLGVSGGTSYGGGLAVGDGTHHFAHSTINDNRAIGMDSFGGGLFFFGVGHSTTLDHTIVANGIAAFGRDASSSIPVTLRHSLVENTSGFSFTDAGGNILNQDPNLGPLQNNGGPTETHALLAASPAVNGGDPSAMAGMGNIPQFDQRGMPFGRVENGRIDIGAFELQPPPGPSCDFDTDGDCDIDDMDELVMEIAAATNNPSFDLTGDGSVDLDDRDQWLADAGALNLPSTNPYLMGDANLDGVVDVQDFNAWNANKFTATGQWSLGDFSADGVTDVQDFNAWNANKFQSSDRLAGIPRSSPAAPQSTARPIDRVFAEASWRDELEDRNGDRRAFHVFSPWLSKTYPFL